MEVDALTDKTIQFSIKEERDEEMRQVLRTVYDALGEKGYNPISQIVGYILSEDPTYITTHNNARSLIRNLKLLDLFCAGNLHHNDKRFRHAAIVERIALADQRTALIH